MSAPYFQYQALTNESYKTVQMLPQGVLNHKRDPKIGLTKIHLFLGIETQKGQNSESIERGRDYSTKHGSRIINESTTSAKPQFRQDSYC